MIQEIQGKPCNVTAGGAARLDTIGNIITVKVNTDEIVTIVPFSAPNYPNTELVIFSNNNGYIITTGVLG